MYAKRLAAVPKFGARRQFTPSTGVSVNGLNRGSDVTWRLVWIVVLMQPPVPQVPSAPA